MNSRPRFFRHIACLALTLPCLVGAQSVVLTPDHADGIYETGQTIRWQVEWKGDPTNALSYTLRRGGLTEMGKGVIALTDNLGTLETKLDEPGTLLAEIKWGNSRGQRVLAGAVAAPRKIALSAPRPADFDAFWAAKIKDLEAVPANPHLESVDVGKPAVDYRKITLDNIRGSHIQGQIARPKEGTKFPALLIVQWAGVYALDRQWAVNRASQGWLVLNIEAHDLPIDQPATFYSEQNSGPLRNYPGIGNDDRETSYFLRMYLSCYRAAQYLTERPDWDGRTLVVTGDSQGGQQTLITAGLHPKITAAIALVPAGCDMLGPVIGRKGGWPQWYDAVTGKDAAKVREASRYFDAANFASRIKCPVLVGLGLIDETCPPAGVLAVANQIKSPVEIVILPTSGHQDANGSQAPFRQRRETAWLPALRQGQAAPVMP